jgi:hypothetical protein
MAHIRVKEFTTPSTSFYFPISVLAKLYAGKISKRNVIL